MGFSGRGGGGTEALSSWRRERCRVLMAVSSEVRLGVEIVGAESALLAGSRCRGRRVNVSSISIQ